MAAFDEEKLQNLSSTPERLMLSPRELENQIPLFAHLISAPLVEVKGDDLVEVPVLQYKDEREMLQRTLAESQCVIRWRSEVATHDSFVKNATESRVLHFTGHGLPEILCVEDVYGQLQKINHSDLEGLFNVMDTSRSADDSTWLAGRPELVFVSACHSEACAKAFVDAGVPHAIGIKETYPILDTASLAFTNTLYQKLLIGWNVDRAFECAKQRVAQDSEIRDEADKFLLLPDPSEDSRFKPDHHSKTVFENLQIVDTGSGFKDISEQPCPSSCPAISPYFLGRSENVYEVYQHLVNKARLVSIAGPRGIGKTQVALGTAYYAQERHHFDQIIFVGMGDLSPQTPFEQKIAEDFGLIRHLREMELLEQIRAKCEPNGLFRGRVLTVLDGCQSIWHAGAEQVDHFKFFLSKLLEQVPGLQMIVTLEEKMGELECNVVEKVVTLRRLHNEAAAELFVKLMPRQLSNYELFMGNPSELRSWTAAFGQSSIIRALDGHPMAIAKVVPHLDESMNLLLCENEILKIIQTIKHDIKHGKENRLANMNLRHVFSEVAAKDIWLEILTLDETKEEEGPVDHPPLFTRQQTREQSFSSIGDMPAITDVDWGNVQRFFTRHFNQKLGQAAVNRPLEYGDFLFLKTSPKLWNNKEEWIPARNNNKVHYQAFCQFWLWFQSQTICLSVTNLYGITQPVKVVRPFINLQTSSQYLRGRHPGTFLVRLSETCPFTYTITYVKRPNEIDNVRVGVNPSTFDIETIYNGQKTRYTSLQHLILNMPQLRFFLGNPDVPKEEVFTS